MAQTRLAIIDLSAAGRQPMCSIDGRFVLIYNGEVYNYLELRSQLEKLGREFRSRTDTEVVLQALIEWGPDALHRFNGMWALSLLDRESGTILLSRDRLGIKPLYYLEQTGQLIFASEIKAVLAMSDKRFRVHPAVVDRYLRQSLLDAQAETFFEGVRALPAGSSATVDLRRGVFLDRPTPYWKPPLEPVEDIDEDRLIEHVRELVFDSVRLRLRSDVPVGVLLSGGLDSSTVAAAMQETLGRRADLHLLSAVSNRTAYSEEAFVDRMSAHLGCATHKVRLQDDPVFLFDALAKVCYVNDEPVGGFANVAHWLLMSEAKEQGITVILSGQGADELLGGYRKYLGFYLQDLLQRGEYVHAIQLLTSFAQNRTILSQFRLSEARRYLPKWAQTRGIDIRGPALREVNASLALGLGSGLQARQAVDLTRYSVPALLHFEDRMSMSHSREIRVPFLDHRLIQLLLPLSSRYKLRAGWTKWILRRAMERYLPPSICWRKDKQGFVNPEPHWLRHELRSKISALLAGDLLIADWQLVNRVALRQQFDRYCTQSDRFPTVWSRDILRPIILELWARQYEQYLSA